MAVCRACHRRDRTAKRSARLSVPDLSGQVESNRCDQRDTAGVHRLRLRRPTRHFTRDGRGVSQIQRRWSPGRTAHLRRRRSRFRSAKLHARSRRALAGPLGRVVGRQGPQKTARAMTKTDRIGFESSRRAVTRFLAPRNTETSRHPSHILHAAGDASFNPEPTARALTL